MALIATVLVAALSTSGCGGDDAESSTGAISIAAASDLRPAFEELGATFEERTGTPVTFSFGSSGTLSQQIVNGAPFDLFASASTEYVDDVIDSGLGDPRSRTTYGYGRIAVWSPDREYDLSDLADPELKVVAIANPEHAPYGQAADESLKRSGEIGAVEPKLVLGESISDTQALAESGNADAAITALSLAIPSDGKWTLIPERLHDPIKQVAVAVGDGDGAEEARKFLALLTGPAGRKVLRSYGFILPDEAGRASGGAGERK